MTNKRLQDIDTGDIEALVEGHVSESRTLDYKERLPGNSDGDKKEFLADVSSFANAYGGDIVYGITEGQEAGRNNGTAAQVVGLAGVNPDAVKLQLESTIRDGIEPRIPGVQTQCVPCATGPVVIIRIPRSWASPHMVTFNNSSRFYSRNSAGKYQLDVHEIRAAFAQSASITSRVREFVDGRLDVIAANEGPVSLPAEPTWGKVALHLYPLSALIQTALVDIADLPASQPAVSLPDLCMNNCGATGRFNLDGFVLQGMSGPPPRTCSYAQVFRSGIIEAVEVRDVALGKFLPTEFDVRLIACLQQYLTLLRAMQVPLPIVVCLTWLNVKDYILGVYQDQLPPHLRSLGQNQPFDRSDLRLPEVVIESFEERPTDILKPVLDALYQAGGWARCLRYNDNGEWTN